MRFASSIAKGTIWLWYSDAINFLPPVGESIEIHDAVFDVLMKVLSVMPEGKPFTLIPLDEELLATVAQQVE
ncbi:MAG: hypothetical protein R3C53_17570 [Pirellulaceae bacterium]